MKIRFTFRLSSLPLMLEAWEFFFPILQGACDIRRELQKKASKAVSKYALSLKKMDLYPIPMYSGRFDPDSDSKTLRVVNLLVKRATPNKINSNPVRL